MTIQKKVLFTIVFTNIFISMATIYFFYTTSMTIINKNMEIQANEIENSIINKIETMQENMDQINYSLVLNEYDSLKKAGQEPYQKKDTYESILLKEELLEEIEPLYQFQYYMSGLAIYSNTNLLASRGYIYNAMDSSILKDFPSNQYGLSIEDSATITSPINIGGSEVGKIVGNLNLEQFLSDEIADLPLGTQISAKDFHGKTIITTVNKRTNDRGNLYKSEMMVPNLSMTFELELPKQHFLGSLTKELQRMVGVLLLLNLIGTAFAAIILLRISDNIKKINTAMMKVKNKNLDVSVDIRSKDELAKIGAAFNEMVNNINELMIENLNQEKEKKEIELDFLQAQINPHFLSNTLNSITWMADLQEAENISRLSKALIQLLHASMYKGKELITLEEELNHVKSYIDIQQVAYPNSFDVSFEINEEDLNLKVLRFILQPIVENSIIHNFVNGDLDNHGLITIKAEVVNQSIYLIVTDNGKGISVDTLEEKNRANQKKKYTRIGIKNIDRRIKLYFGNEYGLTFETKFDQYTKVQIKLPLMGDGNIEESSINR